MTFILTDTQKEAFTALFHNVDFNDVKNFFALMKVPVEYMYLVAVEIQSEPLFNLAAEHKVFPSHSPYHHAIFCNSIKFYELCCQTFLFDEQRAFNYAIENGNQLFIDYFLTKTPTVTFAQILLAVENDVRADQLKRFLVKANIDIEECDTSVITNAVIKKKSMVNLKIIRELGFKINSMSLTCAILSGDASITEFVINNCNATLMPISPRLSTFERTCLSQRVKDILTFYNIDLSKI